jgi:hypothetical protein
VEDTEKEEHVKTKLGAKSLPAEKIRDVLIEDVEQFIEKII